MLNLDTHVLLHAVAGRLSTAETRLLRNDQWGVSAIVLWEIAKLAQLGRIAVDLDDADVARVLARVQVWPLTREIARMSRGSTCEATRPTRSSEPPVSYTTFRSSLAIACSGGRA